jgi:hypothetical protein
MIIPNNEQCRRIIDECGEFMDELTEFEFDFVESNVYRPTFTDKQKEVCANLATKYSLKSFP